MDKQTFFLNHLRETKGTHLYVADNEDTAPIKSVYVKKSAIKGERPECIQVTVEAVSE